MPAGLAIWCMARKPSFADGTASQSLGKGTDRTASQSSLAGCRPKPGGMTGMSGSRPGEESDFIDFSVRGPALALVGANFLGGGGGGASKAESSPEKAAPSLVNCVRGEASNCRCSICCRGALYGSRSSDPLMPAQVRADNNPLSESGTAFGLALGMEGGMAGSLAGNRITGTLAGIPLPELRGIDPGHSRAEEKENCRAVGACVSQPATCGATASSIVAIRCNDATTSFTDSFTAGPSRGWPLPGFLHLYLAL